MDFSILQLAELRHKARLKKRGIICAPNTQLDLSLEFAELAIEKNPEMVEAAKSGVGYGQLLGWIMAHSHGSVNPRVALTNLQKLLMK